MRASAPNAAGRIQAAVPSIAASRADRNFTTHRLGHRMGVDYAEAAHVRLLSGLSQWLSYRHFPYAPCAESHRRYTSGAPALTIAYDGRP